MPPTLYRCSSCGYQCECLATHQTCEGATVRANVTLTHHRFVLGDPDPTDERFCPICGFRLDLHRAGVVRHPSPLEAAEAWGDR